MNENTIVVLQLGAQLLQQLETINAMIQQAQASGTDLTPAQVDSLVSDYGAVHAQLSADIAAAKAAGK